jgi:hypothetical protein
VLIAADQLRQLGDRAALARRTAESPESIHQKQLKKHDYYATIRDRDLIPLGEMEVALRRLQVKEKRASFHVVLDKLDASGSFVRFSIDVTQTDATRASPLVVMEQETAHYTEELRSLIYRFTSLDAEFTFVKLATLGGLEVERVIKGTVGPIYHQWMTLPDELAPIVGNGDIIATFSLDMAATDVSSDKDNDPFDELASTRLSAAAREDYTRAREKLGYHVFKDRKFAVSRHIAGAMNQLCNHHGTNNIIYPIRG